MFVDVKDLETGEALHENLEASDIMLGAFDGDDRAIVFLTNGEQLTFAPRSQYLISEHQSDQYA